MKIAQHKTIMNILWNSEITWLFTDCQFSVREHWLFFFERKKSFWCLVIFINLYEHNSIILALYSLCFKPLRRHTAIYLYGSKSKTIRKYSVLVFSVFIAIIIEFLMPLTKLIHTRHRLTIFLLHYWSALYRT